MTRQVTHSQSIDRLNFSSESQDFIEKDDCVDIQRGEKLPSVTHENAEENIQVRDTSSTDSDISAAII